MLATAERGRQQGARAVNGGETRDKWPVVVVVEKRSSHFPKGANVLSSHLREQKCTWCEVPQLNSCSESTNHSLSSSFLRSLHMFPTRATPAMKKRCIPCFYFLCFLIPATSPGLKMCPEREKAQHDWAVRQGACETPSLLISQVRFPFSFSLFSLLRGFWMQCEGEHGTTGFVRRRRRRAHHAGTLIPIHFFFSTFLSSPCPALNSDYETRARMEEDSGKPGCATMSPSETPSHFTGVSPRLFFLYY